MGLYGPAMGDELQFWQLIEAADVALQWPDGAERDLGLHIAEPS